MIKKESAMSSVVPEMMISDVQSLLEQGPSSVEGLRDKLRVLAEEWSNISGSQVYNIVYMRYTCTITRLHYISTYIVYQTRYICQ